MHRIALVLGLFGIITLSGCDRSPAISAEDIARAQGIKKWHVQLPDDITENTYIGIVLAHADGSTTSSGGSSGYEPGATVTVLMWQAPGAKRWRYAILDENSTTRGSIKDEYGGGFYTYPHETTAVVQPGDYLIKGSEENSVSASQPLTGKEYGFKVEVRKQ